MSARKAIHTAVNPYDVVPLTERIPAERQSAKRHYGVHPYFTRRPHNVVRAHIAHYSRDGDRVLDPFGGSGVTAIEAWLENRAGLHNDINPLANFIASGIVGLASGNVIEYSQTLSALREECASKIMEIEDASAEQISTMLERLPLPANVALPRTSDVQHYRELFTPWQLASLALLKRAIDRIDSDYLRNGMLLAWSATLPKLTRTFLSAEGRAESRGGSSIFSIYRYKVAAKPINLPAWSTFEERARNVIEAKREIDKTIELKRRTSIGWCGDFEVFREDVIELADSLENTVDYIFTDPPYGSHIAYLDLSVLWNVWLGLNVSHDTRDRELIVGGELKLSEEWYIAKLAASILACVRMLKPGRWMSVVFQHWNFRFFEAILDAAEEAGADLRAAVSQIGDPIWSMHKKKNRESVLAGELILTFHKGERRRAKSRGSKVFDVAEVVSRILRENESGAVYGEYLLNQLVVDAWRHSAIGSLNVSRDDFVALMRDNDWAYDDRKHQWTRVGAKSRGLF